MDVGANITPVELIKKEHLEKLILEILMMNSIKTHGKNLMS